MSKTIIFDFDGTIADSSALIRAVYNDMAAEHGWPHLNEAQYQRLRGLKATQLQHWIGVKSWQIPGVMREGLKRFREHSKDITLFDGIPEVIAQLASAGNILYILSTNNPETIKEVLGRYGLKEQVTVLRRSALFGKHYAIRHLLSKYKYVPENVWMIGDEVRDIEAAKRAGVKAAAVSWGLQTSNILKNTAPDALAAHPADLLNILAGTP
ncbi:MAG TPA: HAD-IA family hydrolase [Candidatus Limnocylindrales bacterium]|nr:HAD-IA family hydrolase [Candidatus Limnocylindrales bacterium]